MTDLSKKTQQEYSVKDAFKQIIQVWHARLSSLSLGILLSLIALTLGLALMSFAGGKVALTAMGILVTSSLFLKLIGLGRLIMRYVERLYTHNAMFRALSDLRIWFFRKLAKESAAGLGFRHSGDILSRLVSDIETLDGLYLRLVLPFAGSVLTFLILSVVIARLNVALAIAVGICYLLAAFICPFLAGFITRKRGSKLTDGLAQLRIVALDFIHGLREIRAFGGEERIEAFIYQKESVLFKEQTYQVKEVALISTIAFLCNRMAILLVLMAALHIGFQGLNGFHSVFCLFLTIAAFELTLPLSKAGGLAGQIANAAVRVVNVNQGHRKVEEKEHIEVAPLQGDICFKNLSFRWNEDRPWLYQNLNLTIAQGEKVAIIGPSGVGKSTLAALLLKVIMPQQGCILFEDKNIAQLSTDSVRKRIAWLSQNTHLFDDTIRQNLLLGNPEATEEELWTALAEASVAKVVREMPDGLDTWLGEGGVKVSGGQGRRIALARTLLFKAPILLLDEPTTGLDADTEAGFFQTLNHIAKDRTIILIVHRLTGVEQIDKVWRLSKGHLISDR